MLRGNLEEYNFKDFIDQFIHPSSYFLSNEAIPRIIAKIKKILYLSEHARTCD